MQPCIDKSHPPSLLSPTALFGVSVDHSGSGFPAPARVLRQLILCYRAALSTATTRTWANGSVPIVLEPRHKPESVLIVFAANACDLKPWVQRFIPPWSTHHAVRHKSKLAGRSPLCTLDNCGSGWRSSLGSSFLKAIHTVFCLSSLPLVCKRTSSQCLASALVCHHYRCGLAAPNGPFLVDLIC